MSVRVRVHVIVNGDVPAVDEGTHDSIMPGLWQNSNARRPAAVAGYGSDGQSDLPDGIQGRLTLFPAETSAHGLSEFNGRDV